jgi:hypothetical protein
MQRGFPEDGKGNRNRGKMIPFCSFVLIPAVSIPEYFRTIVLQALLVSGLLLPVLVSGQKVHEDFPTVIFADDFSADRGNWDIRSDPDNLFLIQNDEYLLKRKSRQSEAAVTCSWKIPCPAWELKTSFRLDAGSKQSAFAGVVFMKQPTSDGFLLEINGGGRFRLRQVVRAGVRLMTGTTQEKGWVSSPAVLGAGRYNLVRIRYSNKDYDIYVNETLVASFTEVEYRDGAFGFVAGPASAVHVDAVTVYAPRECAPPPPAKPVVRPEPVSPGDTAARMRQLQLRVMQLEEENRVLRDSIRQKD